MCLSNKLLVFISLLTLVSTQLVAAPPENPPPIEVDVFVVNDDANAVPVTIQGGESKEPVLLKQFVVNDNFVDDHTEFIDQFHTICIGESPTCETNIDGRYVVPDGMTLHINTEAFMTRAISGDVPPQSGVTLIIQVPGATTFVFNMGMLQPINPTDEIFGKVFDVDIIAPAGAKISARVTWASFGSGKVEASMTISGELVSAP